MLQAESERPVRLVAPFALDAAGTATAIEQQLVARIGVGTPVMSPSR